jgi:hypothetical protein
MGGQMKKYFSIFMLLSLAACNYRINKDGVNGSGEKPIDVATLDYATIHDEVLKNYCLRCHQPKDDVDLTTYALVVENLKDIDKDVRSGEMPKEGSLPPDKKQMLLSWIAVGAPEFAQSPPEATPTPIVEPSPSPSATPTEPPPAINFALIQTQIIEPKCLKCHGEGGKSDIRLDLYTTYQDPDIVNLEDPDSSKIIKEVSPRSNGRPPSMPPRSSGITPLTPEEVETLRQWIRLGIPQ